MECSRRLFLKKCGCQPYFYPIRGKDMKVCGIHDVDCSFDASKMAQMLAFPSSSVQIELNELGLLCSCPSSCNEVIYSIETSSAPFPSEMAYQSSETIQQTVAKGKGKVDLRFLHQYRWTNGPFYGILVVECHQDCLLVLGAMVHPCFQAEGTSDQEHTSNASHCQQTRIRHFVSAFKSGHKTGF
ncbi:pickpocket protein 28-like isoform X2 [Tigriopus californicus]|uniref:pickpocket protein 28-like isoform X2 n=1 Tax=Tigriopus californicus TaxID=6832 RepID=UPI0027DA02E4|nr:pickpocket protein 28-like isoform X2 [Tigriopus californicus]